MGALDDLVKKKQERDKKLSYKERNGTTRVGDFLRKIGKAAPELLEAAGKVTGISQLEELGRLIDKDDKLSPKDKELALKELELDMMELQLETVREQEVSKRWQADMHSDSWLSKNVRPVTLAFLLISTITILILDAALEDFKVQSYWVELLGSLTITALGGYFVLRQIGKYTDKKLK